MSAKKILCSFIVSSFIISLVPVTSAVNPADFNVKIATAGDETYTTNLNNVSYFNSDITFQFIEVSGGGAEEYSLNLPTGFLYQSYNTTGNTCANFSLLNASNGNYHFSFNGTAGCLAKTEFTYRVTSATIPWNTNISLLSKTGSNWSIAAVLDLGITSSNSIIRAATADLNANGYIDAYILSFATTAGVSASTLSWVTVAWVGTATATASGSDWIIPFTDNILGTGNTPQIGGIFDSIPLTNTSVNETDGACPRVMTIAGTTTNTWTVAIGTGSLIMTLSEPLSPSSAGSFSLRLGTGTVSGIMSLTGNLSTLIFVPTSPLIAGTYTLANTAGATDWPAGSNSVSRVFPNLVVADITPPGNGSILINNGASTTTSQTVSLTLGASDNIGVATMMVSDSPSFVGAVWESYATAKANWSLASSALGVQTVYVKFRDLALNVSPVYSANITIVAPPPSGGGGWWGGWGWGGGGWGPSPDNCPSGDFSGNSYDTICNAPITGTGITGTGGITATGTVTIPVAPWIPTWFASPSDLSSGTFDVQYFPTLAEARTYLLSRISHPSIVKLINTYGDKLAIADDSYFLSIDRDLYVGYNRIINAYALLFLRVQDAVSGNRSESVKSDGRASVGIVMSGVTLVKNLLDRYVTRSYIHEKNITLYRTKNPLLAKPLAALEEKVIAKFDALLWNGNISRSEYDTSVQAYNDFILHLMIYRDYGKSALAKDRALAAIKIFTATYAKKVTAY